MAAIPPVVAATISRVEVVALSMFALLGAVVEGLSWFIILLNLLIRSFEVTPVTFLPSLLSATRENRRARTTHDRAEPYDWPYGASYGSVRHVVR